VSYQTGSREGKIDQLDRGIMETGSTGIASKTLGRFADILKEASFHLQKKNKGKRLRKKKEKKKPRGREECGGRDGEE